MRNPSIIPTIQTHLHPHRYAFDTSVQVVPIPELVPMRLTQCLRGALLPHTAVDVLRPLMEAAMACMRDGSVVLGGLIEVLCREPVADWAKEAGHLRGQVDAATYARHKVEWSLDKLRGRHPAEIMVEQLRWRHQSKAHWESLKAHVRGVRGEDGRASCGEVLTTAEQVACLLEMATDANLLGRMYAGWLAWL